MKLASHVRSFGTAMCVVALTVTLSTAFAQQKHKTVSELAKEADVVAVGRVTALKSEWDEGKTRIVTRASIAIDEYLKEGSDRSKTLTIVTLGGEVGDVGELYTHVPSFRHNEEVIVFLTRDARGSYSVSSGTQGVYLVERDEATGKPLVAGKHPLSDFTAYVKREARD